MRIEMELKSEAKIISEYYKNSNNSIWLKEGIKGSISTEIESISSLIKNLEDRKKIFTDIPLTIVPFNSSGIDFKIIIQNDFERTELISILKNYKNQEIIRHNNYSHHKNKNVNIMENNLFQGKKADLEVKIQLPKQEKSFFEKMTTPKNLVNMLQKAGQKLNPNEVLDVSLNGTYFKITKEQTQKSDILQSVATEYDKVRMIKNEPPAENKNLNDLKDQIKYLGFGEEPRVHNELAENLASGKDFIINVSSDKASFKNNEINFELRFQKSENSEKFYLNSFLANLKNDEKDVNLSHTFSANGSYTAKAAINLLEGRSVRTQIYSKHSEEKEDAFVKLQLNEEKNEKGNFKLQVFNKNYGIDVEKIIDKAKLQFENEKHREITTKSLEKGNIVSVKFPDQKSNIIEGKAILNPQYKMLNLYDNKMKRVNSNEQAFQRENSETNEVKNQQSHSRKI